MLSFVSSCFGRNNRPQSTASHTTAAPEDLMITLISAGIIPPIGLIIMSYATPSLRVTSPFNRSNPCQFFTSRLQVTCFSYDFSDLAEIHQHCIWGRFDEVKKTLEEVKKKSERDPHPLLRIKSLLTNKIDVEDHRPGFIREGTLLEHALYTGDFLNGDAEMLVMLKRIVLETCGLEEYKRQVGRAKTVIEEENKKKVAIEAKDELALNEVWNILKIADPNLLNSNTELKSALGKFDNQLRGLGNENIVQKAINLFERDYSEFGGYKGAKNIFAKNRIIGLAQLRRLSACDLQICFPGLHHSLRVADDRVIAKRIDVRQELGVLPGDAATHRLGDNYHVDIFDGDHFVRGPWRAPSLFGELMSMKSMIIQGIYAEFEQTPHPSALRL